MDEISLKAPAKINLYLKVLGKRPDGYHEIESMMQTIDLYDEIKLEKANSIEIDCNDPSLPSDGSNLAVRAAIALKERFYFPGVKIGLNKRIPHGAGLGGGSSDAAFVLRGLCRLYELSPKSKEILEIASGIGSDVPFFLGNGQAIVGGRGEKVHSIDLPTEYRVILITPPLEISTAEVYGKLKFSLTKKSEPFLLKKKITISRFNKLAKRFYNDLEEVVLGEHPDLAKIKGLLKSNGAVTSAMSGSGSTFFGIFHLGGEVKAEFKGRLTPGTRVFSCKPVVLAPFNLN
ncbi:MAG: 4-(cytidine 5'-diphospho)-2-C-methyl-D-erythritol kinase [candidate division Zixibacteria bacterium]